MKLPEDEFILELLPEFVETWITDIEEKFDVYFDAKDDKEMYRLAHTLKGSCFQFSLDEIAETGVALLEETKAQNWESIKPYKEKLLKMFIDVDKYLKENGITG